MNMIRGLVSILFLMVIAFSAAVPVSAGEHTTVMTPALLPGIVNTPPVNSSNSTTDYAEVGTKPVSFITDADTGEEYVSDEVIVRYNTTKFRNVLAMRASASGSHMKIGAKVQDDFSKAGLPGMQVVKLPSNLSVNDAIAEYRKNPDILYVQPNYIYHTAALTPDDPYYYLQWGLNNTENVYADINAPDAWGVSTGSNAVIVAVIDTGVDYNHPDLSSNIWINPGESGLDDLGSDKRFNGIDDDDNGYTDDWHGWNFYDGNNDPMDGNTGSYHGTHCAGILGAAGNNGVGVCGVSWNLTIMPLRTTDVSGLSNSSSNIMAINYASANAAGIISNSWGGYSYDQALKDAIDNSPAMVVCAAGNDNVNTDLNPFYPASFNSTNLISVAATDSSDNKASFSNYGQITVDLAAPGVTIYSTKKDSTYQFKSGTSMATPFVTGVAALVKSTNPLLTNNQIKNIIFNNIEVKPSLSGKVNTSGRLNAYKAVLAAQRMAQPEMIGVVRHNNTWLLDASGNGAWGPGDIQYTFGQPGDVYVTGDWTGNGITKVGVVRFNNTWLLDASGNGAWGAGDLQYTFGQAGDRYVTGDWTGNGTTKIGVGRFNNTWLLDTSGNGAWGSGDVVYTFGKAGDRHVTGDWTGNGTTKIGVVRFNNTWLLDTSGNGAWGAGDIQYAFGKAGDAYVSGEWN